MFNIGDHVVLIKRHPNRDGISPNVGQYGIICDIDYHDADYSDYKFRVEFREEFCPTEKADYAFYGKDWWCGEQHIKLVDRQFFEIKSKDLIDLL